jgi:hypothetical protein
MHCIGVLGLQRWVSMGLAFGARLGRGRARLTYLYRSSAYFMRQIMSKSAVARRWIFNHQFLRASVIDA